MNATQDEEDIFLAALEISKPADRAAYLNDACGEDANLRRRVEALLVRHQESQGLLDAPPPGIDATAHWEVISEKPGAVIGPYKLLEQIGEGGFGVVFLAEQTAPVRRRVALKVIKPGMDTRQVIARFEAERQALAMMDHPNIARVLDAGTTASEKRDGSLLPERPEGSFAQKTPVPFFGGRPYFVMELVQGVPITEYCDQCNLTTRERLELFISVCHAVQHAHQKGVIHRDIKPTNVLVAMQDGRPAPKIIDFGVAKAIGQRLTEHTLATGFAQMVGTPLYMSPEQAELSPLGVDTRSDIYSLGVLLYELLTGTTPFDKDRLYAASYDELRRIIREEEPPRPSARISTLAADLATTIAEHRGTDARQLGKTVRGELDWIVMKCLEKDRNRRYESTNALAQDVQRYLTGETVSACPPSATYRFRKFAGQHRYFFAAASLVAAVTLIGTAVSAWQAIRATRAEGIANQQRQSAEETALIAEQQKELALRQRDVALNNLYAASIPLAYKDWQEGNLNRMSDGLMAFLPEENIPDLRGWEWYFLASLLEEDESVLRPHIGSVGDVIWSPDGHLLAVGGAHGVKICEPVSKQLVRSLAGTSPIAWHPKELRLATATKHGIPGEVTIWDVQSGNALRQFQSGPIYDMSWRQDGGALAWGGDKTFEIWWEGEQRAEVHEYSRQDSPHGIRKLTWSPDGQLLVLGVGFPAELVIWSAERNDFLENIAVWAGTAVHAMHWNATNDQLAMGMHNGAVHVWDVIERREPFCFLAHGGGVSALAWSPDGTRFATGGSDKLIKVWDSQSHRPLHERPGHKRAARTVDWSVWDSQSHQPLHQFAGHKGNVRTVDWSPGGALLASGDVDGTVRIWRSDRDQEAMSLPGSTSAAWSPDGKKVVTEVFESDARGGAGRRVPTICDAETAEVLLRLEPGIAPGICKIAWSPDGNWIGVAVDGQNGAVYVWNAKSAELVHEQLAAHTHPDVSMTSPCCFAWSPNSRLFATSGSDHRIKIWQTSDGELVRVLEGHNSPVGTVRWSPDGRRLLSADWARHVKIWDTATWKPITDLFNPPSGGADGNYSSAWSPDSRRVATRSGASDLVVWELSPRREPRRIWTARAHSSNIRSIAWSPDGRRIASSSEDSKIKIWDAETGRELLAFDEVGSVPTVAWSPDGSRLLAVSSYREREAVRIWDARKALSVRWEERKSRSAEQAEGPQ